MKTLLLYYSFGGNTRRIACHIQEILGCDTVEIQTVNAYTGSYDEVVDQGQREVEMGFEPELKPLALTLDDYNTVILGTPVWWYTFAPAVKTVLSTQAFTGKTVYPFATNGGWIGHTFKDVETACVGAAVKPGLNIRFDEDRMQTPMDEIDRWIQRI